MSDNYFPYDEKQDVVRRKSTEINPSEYFGGWHYNIGIYHYPAFSVMVREFIDKEKTKKKREESGEKIASVKNKIKVMKNVWSISAPVQFNFHEGDVFYHVENSQKAIQIVHINQFIEVHLIDIESQSNQNRKAYFIQDISLANWLKTGIEPEEKRISIAQSMVEISRYSIIDPDFIQPPNMPSCPQMNLTF